MSARSRTTARRSARRALIGAGVLALGLAVCGASAGESRVDVYHSPARPVHGEVVDALSQALRDDPPAGIRLRPIDLDGVAAAGVDGPPTMRLAIGASASRWLAHRGGASPRLFGLIPSTVWQSLQTCCDLAEGRDAARFIDRSLTEHLRLAAAFVQDGRPVGVLLGPASVDQRPALEAAAQRLEIALTVEQVADGTDVGPALRRLVDDVGALLALPDPVVFNRDSLYAILLTAYGAGVPTIGYSEPMVRAGAAAAVYTRPSEAGLDLARLIRDYAAQGSLPSSRRVPTASIALNADVIRSLRLDIGGESALLEALSRGAP